MEEKARTTSLILIEEGTEAGVSPVQGDSQTGLLAPLVASLSPTLPPEAREWPVPTLIGAAGEQASRRFLEFFTVNIRNPNTRAAYAQACGQFLGWCEQRGLRLETLEPMWVAAYIEGLGKVRQPQTVKQHLAAIRMLFDWLVVGQVLRHNPAHAVRGPRYSISKGKTPVLDAKDARRLLDSIDTSQVIGLRDRALIGTMVYSFARVSAVVGMRVEDYYPNGKRWWLRLHEKGGKFHEVPAHHLAEEYLDAYLDAAGIREDRKGKLFRTAPGHRRQLTERAIDRTEVFAMIRRRARDAGLSPTLCCHTFRATGITAYLQNQGTLEHAQRIAAHESVRTTKLYDRRGDQVSLDEIERIVL
jgi:site-specific recombinase XerC